MTPARTALAVLAILSGTGFASAQVKEPLRAEKLDVQIRYRIRAERDERVRQYRALEKFLTSLGFEDSRKDDPDRDLDILDPTAERFNGTIPSARVLDLFNDSRILNVLFAPTGLTYPDSGEKPVAIRVIIRGGLIPNVQQLFHTQVLQQLERLGFRNALGYDTRGYTQLKGTIPYKNLDLLVKDLRGEPSGWFLPTIPMDQLPRPLADRNPIRWVEVMPVTDPPPPFAPEVVLPARARLTPDLRALLLDPAAKETPLRVEVLFSTPMEDQLESLRSRLIGAYGPTLRRAADGTPAKGPDGLTSVTEGASLDGASGNVVTLRLDRPADAERFAFETGVLSIRLPRRAVETVLPQPADQKPLTTSEILKLTGAEALHRLGYAGTGVKVLVIGSDFTGAEKLIGTALPRKTRILDLTTELNPEIRPLPADPNRLGVSVAAAQAAALTAPDAELVLVRIDTGSFFQLSGIIRVARGDTAYSDAMRSRLIDLSHRSTDLSRRKDAAVVEYRQAFEDLGDDEPTRARRVRAKTALEVIIAEQAELVKRLDRFNAFQKEITAALAGGRVVVNTLVWETGYPLDALSELSRSLERMTAPLPTRVTRRAGDPAAMPRQPITWVQAASASGPAVWGGPFLDLNRNGTMEFAPLDRPLPATNWSPEMNFLGFQGSSGEVTGDLPAGARVRFTIQWREPIDPGVVGGDRPVYPVVLRLFRQIDPKGEKRPSDELAEDARSTAGPYAIYRTNTLVVYEQMLDFTVPAAGRFALAIALGSQPEALLPALRREIETYPRIFAETLTSKAGEGKVVFQSYVTPAGVGIPGDSLGAVAVGSLEVGALFGGGTGLTLRLKPDVLGPDVLGLPGNPAVRGTAPAAGYVGGMAANLLQAGAAGASLFRAAGVIPGKLIVVPEGWMRHLRPIPRPPEK